MLQVNKSNYHIGCRVCRKIIRKSSVNLFENYIPDFKVTYQDALTFVSGEEILMGDGLPERLCSDCGARLCISYHFKRDALDSSKMLATYRDSERTENDLYEVIDEDLDMEADVDYAGDEDCEIVDEDYEVGTKEEDDGEDNAVSFLTGFLGKTEPGETDVIKIRKAKVIKTEDDDGLNNPSRKHACNVCNKRFQKRSNLIDHLRLHANVKIYACDYCEKSFVQAGNYKAHLRTHTKEKPFGCPYCVKSYSQSSSLKIHIRSHTQEKNYICDVCEKGFTNASDLGKHKLIHEPVKRYKCEECEKPFTQKIHLRKHLEKHHPEKYYDSVLEPNHIKIDLSGGETITDD